MPWKQNQKTSSPKKKKKNNKNPKPNNQKPALFEVTPIPLQNCETELGVTFNQTSFHLLDFPACRQHKSQHPDFQGLLHQNSILHYRSCKKQLLPALTSMWNDRTQEKWSFHLLGWKTTDRFTLTSGSVLVPSTLSQRSSAPQWEKLVWFWKRKTTTLGDVST